MSPYNDSPEAAFEAAEALVQRGEEIHQRWRNGDYPVLDAIQSNMGFHYAIVALRKNGVNYPSGPDAIHFAALVLAAVEHARAQELLESAMLEAPK